MKLYEALPFLEKGTPIRDVESGDVLNNRHDLANHHDLPHILTCDDCFNWEPVEERISFRQALDALAEWKCVKDLDTGNVFSLCPDTRKLQEWEDGCWVDSYIYFLGMARKQWVVTANPSARLANDPA